MAVLTVSRTENKYILTPTTAQSMKRDLQALLTPDDFSKNGAYRVKSLYYDSVNQNNFITKYDGVSDRRKIRLRIYDEKGGAVKLEDKIKKGVYQHKKSLAIRSADARTLAEGDYTVLRHYDEPTANEIYVIMALGLYKPVTLVEYERYALIYPEFSTRITFDSDIKASEVDLRLFERNNNWVFRRNENVIFEVKYNGRLMKEIATIIAKYDCIQVSVSKYCMGRSIFEELLYS